MSDGVYVGLMVLVLAVLGLRFMLRSRLSSTHRHLWWVGGVLLVLAVFLGLMGITILTSDHAHYEGH
ncbi:putative membrane protein [Paenibacillus phyllosphaerae]|uniref:Putative membrane protein n=1 Tax=Paenibacillus phyllosphaerae TaxID=274593 RepID=A0A7W5FR29_9BACL|nr:hypothetical protein [Paenibacillus phyllosphaerae]MBB3113923.1 putative membrane protein [Paenibacillus phyllosphaerae]